MTIDIINLILNAIANILLLISGLYFYYHHLNRKKIGNFCYRVLRLATAMLISGALMRVLVDIDYVLADRSSSFIWYESAIALLRNYGLSIILLYTVVKYREIKKKFC